MPNHLSPLREIVSEHLDNGLRATEIARLIGRPLSTVTSVVGRLREGGADIPRRTQTGWVFGPPKEPLTSRQQQVIDLLTGGATQAGVARALGVTQPTISSILKAIAKKCAVESRPEKWERVADAENDIPADIAAGKRCGRCWLLLPCDHQ